jgi:hypothetical protein
VIHSELGIAHLGTYQRLDPLAGLGIAHLGTNHRLDLLAEKREMHHRVDMIRQRLLEMAARENLLLSAIA